MDIQEFSKEFDILYDNIASKGAPGLNEYEKSVFLTRAQEDIVRKYFDRKENIKQEGEGESMERSMDFSELIKTEVGEYVNPFGFQKTDKRSMFYKISASVFFLLNNNIKLTLNTKDYITTGTPLSHTEYNYLMTKAYPEPPRRITWVLFRKDLVTSTVETYFEIIPHSKFYGISDSNVENIIRYVKAPAPIVLENFESDPDLSGMSLTVNGTNTVSECELNELIHPQITRRAVEMAKASYIGDINSFVQINDKPV